MNQQFQALLEAIYDAIPTDLIHPFTKYQNASLTTFSRAINLLFAKDYRTDKGHFLLSSLVKNVNDHTYTHTFRKSYSYQIKTYLIIAKIKLFMIPINFAGDYK